MSAELHTPITLLVGSEECFDRECEDYFTEDGEPDPGVERCSHIAEQTVCEQCSTERPDGEYEPVVPWAGPHTRPAA
jgi:hypothetical protein